MFTIFYIKRESKFLGEFSAKQLKLKYLDAYIGARHSDKYDHIE